MYTEGLRSCTSRLFGKKAFTVCDIDIYKKSVLFYIVVPNLGSWYLKQIIRDEPLPLFEIPPDKLAPMHKLTMKLMYVLLYMYNVHIILQVS